MPRNPLERDETARPLWWLIAGMLAVMFALRVALDRGILRSPEDGTEPPVGGIPGPPGAAAAPAVATPVRAFLAWAEARPAQQDRPVDRARVARGLRLLAAALADLVARTSDPEPELVAQLRAVELLIAGPDGRGEATIDGFLHAALASNATALAELRAWVAAGTDRPTALVRSRHVIDPRRPLDDQQEEIARFFDRAAATVREVRADL